MTVAELIAILQGMPTAAVVVLGAHNRENVVAARKHDIALVSMRTVPDEYEKTYVIVAGDDEHDVKGVYLG